MLKQTNELPPELTSSASFIEWLHEVTVLGYIKNLRLTIVDAQLIEHLYKKGDCAADAVDSIEKVLKRVEAINAREL